MNETEIQSQFIRTRPGHFAAYLRNTEGGKLISLYVEATDDPRAGRLFNVVIAEGLDVVHTAQRASSTTAKKHAAAAAVEIFGATITKAF